VWQVDGPPPPPPPPPTPPPPPHLSVMTFYGFNETAQCGWSNVMWQELQAGPHDQPFKKNLSVALWELASFSEHCNGTGFVMLPPALFASPGNRLPANWEAALETFESTVAPFVANGTAIGIFMGDEKLCGGVPLSNYSAVAEHLRKRFGNRILLYGNECSFTVGSIGAVPTELDLFSFDYYDAANTDGAAEVAGVRETAETVVFPKMAPHQRLLLVPGIYGNTPSSCAAHGGGAACALDRQAEQVVRKLDLYLEWAKSEPRVVGFNPWHFSHRGPQNAPQNDMAIGGEEMPMVLAKLRDIGTYIVSQGLPPPRSLRTV